MSRAAVGVDFEPLLRAVFRNPADDTPRLVFADYLDEHDEPARAELIRVQCALPTAPPRTKRRRELVAREKELIAGVMSRFNGPLPWGMKLEFRRGFITLFFSYGQWETNWPLPYPLDSLFRAGWVEAVRLGPHCTVPGAKQCDLLAFAAELDLSENSLGESGVMELVLATAGMHSNPRFCGLKLNDAQGALFDQYVALHSDDNLTVSEPLVHPQDDCIGVTLDTLPLLLRSGRLRNHPWAWLRGAVGDRGAEMIAKADLSGLEALILDSWGVTAAGMTTLANAPAFSGLKRFEIINTPIKPAEMAALGAGTALAGVTHLDFGSARFGDNVLDVLGHATQFRNVEALRLGQCQVTRAGVARFLTVPNFPVLKSVWLEGTHVAEEQLFPLLLGSPPRPELTLWTGSVGLTRWIDGEQIRVSADTRYRFTTAFDRLRLCPEAKRIAAFRLAAAQYAGVVQIEQRFLTGLAADLAPGALRELEISRVALRNDAGPWLAPFGAHELDTLRLVECRVPASGIAQLAASPVLDSLRVLDLSNNPIGKGGVAALVKTNRLANLEQLVLTGSGLGSVELKPLRKKFGAKLVL